MLLDAGAALLHGAILFALHSDCTSTHESLQKETLEQKMNNIETHTETRLTLTKDSKSCESKSARWEGERGAEEAIT